MAKRIPASRVVRVENPAIVASGPRDGTGSITVIPLVDGIDIAGLEIRCRCGAHVVVDCVYDEAVAAETAPQSAAVAPTSEESP